MKKCVIVGCGRNVEDLHIPAFQAIKEIEVVAACDSNKERLDEFGNKHHIKNLFIDLDSFLKSNIDVDFVDISTPGATHFELCKKIIEAGLNLLVEKPLALHLHEAITLKNLVSEAGIIACVAQNYRFRDVALTAADDLRRGRVGKVKQVNVTFRGQSIFNEPTPWSWNEKQNKTLLYEMCIHFLDLQVLFAGRVEKILYCKCITDEILGCTDKIIALVEHKDGAIGCVDIQLNASSNYAHFEIFGSANDILIKFFPEYYRLYSGLVNPLDEIFSELKRICNFAWPALKDKIVKPRLLRRAKSHFLLIKRYIEALDGKNGVPVSFADIIPTMEYLEELSSYVYPGK